MSRILLNKSFWLYTLPLLLAGFFFGGCATTEPENESVRPWNAPLGWENGLPGGMSEGR